MIKCKIHVCWKYPMYQLLSFSLPLTYISMARTHLNTCQLGWLWAPTYTKMQADRSVTMPPTPKQELNKSGTKIQCLTNRVTVMQNVQLLLTTATKSRQIHLGDVNKIIDLSTSPPLGGWEHLTNTTICEIVRRKLQCITRDTISIILKEACSSGAFESYCGSRGVGRERLEIADGKSDAQI